MHKNAIRYTHDEEAFIRVNYPTLGSHYCAKHLNRSVFCIQQKAKRLGIILTKAQKRALHVKARERSSDWYDINPDQFTDIQKPEAAYLLGYVWADGHIAIRKERDGTLAYVWSLTIVRDDYVDIADTINRLGKWRIYQRTSRLRAPRPVTCIATGNKPLVTFLVANDYHIKSMVAPTKILSRIPAHLKHYWWRGYMDGDGCFSYTPSRSQCSMCFAGSYGQDWSAHMAVTKALGIDMCIRQYRTKRGDSSSCLCQNLRCADKWGAYIYQGYDIDHIGLTRKYAKWLSIRAQQCSRDKRESLVLDMSSNTPFSRLALVEAIRRHSGLVSTRKLAAHFGWKPNVISTTICRYLKTIIRSEGRTLSQRYVYIGP